ncbi:DUF413 domain-containing protein [Photobacterium minamisatsumaniensis]|uniref:DUF413 domain-containing protein n=1 Tax=Photobacterium minamisatsumaniensis TaxID=2910233 RepID=UPI003D0C5251
MRSVGKFYDDNNFPRGFNRSGVFTVNEAQLLETFGRTMRGLSDGSLLPISEAEQQFIAEILGQQDIQSGYGKCWYKYITKTSTKIRSYTLCVSQRAQRGRFEDDDVLETDTEIDI